jgi:biotin carboxyl carrier protein
VKRALVRDRLTGDVAGEVEPTAGADGATGETAGVLVLPDGAGRVEVVVDGWRFEFEVEDADRAALRARATNAEGAQARHGPTEVRAIIPGRILTVAVTPGDVVTAGQQLLTVEAMKMQNELRSPRDGTVERVASGPGATVEPGDVLVVLA